MHVPSDGKASSRSHRNTSLKMRNWQRKASSVRILALRTSHARHLLGELGGSGGGGDSIIVRNSLEVRGLRSLRVVVLRALQDLESFGDCMIGAKYSRSSTFQIPSFAVDGQHGISYKLAFVPVSTFALDAERISEITPWFWRAADCFVMIPAA
ncbi:hypothetical protein CEXT_171801 [Caerostris extrusa]|uniref:Uncharacterized protein n=1 Tax=Caerostris extrusa TaxID=172846 RepID=A0AAV4V4D0_CAEEX|nr:hypothetical protein CEXT_171801 [Caerostris extrusa]